MTARRRLLLALRSAPLLALFALAGCADAFGDRDPRAPGEPLGRFHVAGKRTENTCGEGALGAGPTWDFDIALSREGDAIHWNNGGAGVTGTLDDDGVTFYFDATVAVDMREPGEAKLPPCTMSRRDRGSGKLDATEDPSSFKGQLRYDFSPTAGSNCDDLVHGSAPIVVQLPCGFAYAIEATRVELE